MKRIVNIPRGRGLDALGLSLEAGRSVVIIGANGSGKTRLGVHLENDLAPVQRIAAHKSLRLSDRVNLVSLERADRILRFGDEDGDIGAKYNNRWAGNPATHQLSDFDALLQWLFAENNRTAVDYHQAAKKDLSAAVPTTKLGQLQDVWGALLPHRTLQLREAAVEVLPISANGAPSYSGSQMSDGERAIFYFLGQCLVAPADSAIIIDEPEAHVNKVILGALWNAIERARPDCAFVYITHDIDFAATRGASTTYIVRAYDHSGSWDIEELPKDTGLPERVVAELVGSRRPILFVEGERGSLDLTVYRHHYTDFTVVPIGSCEAVIHSVASYNGSAVLHHLIARGLVDADDRTPSDIVSLQEHDVYVLPVAEVENLLLLPGVFLALAEALVCLAPNDTLAQLKVAVMKAVLEDLDLVSSRHAIRQLDRRLKRIGVEARDRGTLQASFQNELSKVDAAAIFDAFKKNLQTSVQASDLEAVLKLYDNKGLLAQAARVLGVRGPKDLAEKVHILLAGKRGARVREELAKVLPAIPV
jgi:energy-coupling factor transporter ATP-binding protein EcfA2